MTIKPMPRLEKILGNVFIVILFPFLLLLVLWFGVIHGLITAKRWVLGPRKEWSRWFAWYPVRLGNWAAPLVWLEWVERRSYSPWYETSYRPTEPAQREGE